MKKTRGSHDALDVALEIRDHLEEKSQGRLEWEELEANVDDQEIVDVILCMKGGYLNLHLRGRAKNWIQWEGKVYMNLPFHHVFLSESSTNMERMDRRDLAHALFKNSINSLEEIAETGMDTLKHIYSNLADES